MLFTFNPVLSATLRMSTKTMSYTASRKSYPLQKDTSTKAVDDGKKKTLLKDNSWIKKDLKDDKSVDQDSNFGRAVLSQFRSTENLTSSSDKTSVTTTTTTPRTSQKSSVQALTRRFSASQDELDSCSKTTTYTKRTSSVKSDSPNVITKETKKTVIEEPKTSTTIKTSKDDTITTVTSTRTSVVESPTKSETFTEKIISDVKTISNGKTKTQPPAETKDTQVKSSSVSKTEIITPSVVTSKETIDQDEKKTVKSVTTPTSTIKTSISTKTFTSNGDVPSSKTTSYSSHSQSSVEDQLFDILVPTSIKSTNSTPDTISDDKSSETSPAKYTRTSYKESRPSDYTSSTVVSTSKTSSPTSYERHSLNGSTTTYTTTTYTESCPEDYLSDTYTSRTVKTVYTTPERKITERDICTYCRKPMLSDVKMLLEDVDIQCHASCFKCEVCNSSLGHLKAGDSMWIYRRAIHCDSCMGVTKDKWLH